VQCVIPRQWNFIAIFKALLGFLNKVI